MYFSLSLCPISREAKGPEISWCLLLRWISVSPKCPQQGWIFRSGNKRTLIFSCRRSLLSISYRNSRSVEKETTETECPCVVGFPRCHERLALQPEGVIAATVRCNQKVIPTFRIFSIALWVELDASVFCCLRRDFLIESAIGEQSARTEIQQSLWSGPAFSQLDLLLPIGSRATPDLRKLTLSIEAACVVPAQGPQYILAQGSWPAKIKVHCDLRGYNTIIHRNSFWNRVSGHCFSILCGPVFFRSS